MEPSDQEASADGSEVSDLVVVGLGANLGASREILASAVDALATAVVGKLRVASLYRSAPVGPPQADFLNSALVIEWKQDLHSLLDLTSSIESRFGRERNVRWGPRTLDLDILLAGSRVVATPSLQIPHPRLESRAFALVPLLELCPGATRPCDAVRYETFLDAVRSQRIDCVSGPNWTRGTARRPTS